MHSAPTIPALGCPLITTCGSWQECRSLTASWVRERAEVCTRETHGREQGEAGPRVPAGADGAQGLEHSAEPAPATAAPMGEDGSRDAGDTRGIELCDFYEALERQGTDAMLPVVKAQPDRRLQRWSATRYPLTWVLPGLAGRLHARAD